MKNKKNNLKNVDGGRVESKPGDDVVVGGCGGTLYGCDANGNQRTTDPYEEN